MKPQFFPELFDAEMRDFKVSAHGGGYVGISGRDSAKAVDVIERAYKVRQPLKPVWADLPAPASAADAVRPVLPAGSTVLITGATGFVGGRIAEMLMEQGIKVRCMIRNFGHATRVARMGPEIVAADQLNAEQVDEAIKGVDYVFHCAHDMRSQPQNFTGLENIIAACLKHKVRRLVYVSTFSVYEPFPDGRLSEETRDGDRGWVYTRSKLTMEEMILKAVAEQNLPATIVQPTIVYGPFCKPWTNAPAENLIYGTVVLPDRGEGLCNAVYIDDLVDGFILAATRPEAIGERFIMSGPKPVTWAEFFRSFAKALRTAPPEFWPAALISKSNQGLLRDIKLVAKNPKRIVQIIVRWYPARQALQAGLDALPAPLKAFVSKHYFGSGARRPGELILPDPQLLNLYAANAYVDNEKAARLLGYRPRYDFAAGMEPTRRYLEWAYGELSKTVAAMAPRPPQPSGTMVGPADPVNVN